MRQFIADNWPWRLWMVVMPLVPPVAVGVWMTIELWHRPVPNDWRSQVCFGVGLLAWLGAGWFGSIFWGWLILSEVYYRQDFKNGAPYQVGDHVRILTGPHRGRVVQVGDQNHTWVRVVLSPCERERYLDWYEHYQVYREPSPEPTPPQQPVDTSITTRPNESFPCN